MILILTNSQDIHADYVVEKLQNRGANLFRFNPADFPTQAEISFSYSPKNQVGYKLHTCEKSIDLNLVKSVWYRRPLPPIPHESIKDKLVHNSVAGECQTFADDVWESLNCLFLPGSRTILERARLKASQLKAAEELGFELPPTLITNSPTEFLEFYRQHNGCIVSKLVGLSFFKNLDTIQRYTEVVTKRDVGYAHSVRYCPIIFQAYVPKRVELRITVVGEQVFASEIHSQTNNHTRYDWRRYDQKNTRYLPHELPPDIAHKCIQLVKYFRLCYGAIDIILTPQGQYVFLEINPNGQYLWIEHETGMPISDAICDLLMSQSNQNFSRESKYFN